MRDPLIWIDLEMTGLDPDRDVILEIAVVLTDGQLREVVAGPDLVVHADEAALAAMVPVVAEMHRQSGLTEASRASRVEVSEAEHAVLGFVKDHVQSQTAPLAGNSVHVDRTFLKRQMPELEAHLHYRNVDVSTVKELVRRWAPKAYEARPEKEGSHRALEDILESIEELRAYRDLVFLRDSEPSQ